MISALARLEIAAARLKEVEVEREFAAYETLRDHAPERLALAASLLANTAFANGDYARAAWASSLWTARLADCGTDQERDDASQLHEVAALIAKAPPAGVSGNGLRIATKRDKAGLMRAPLTIDGIDQMAVLDTGANLPVLSASLARKLHLHMIDGDASVGSSSRDSVPTRIGIARDVSFAGFKFRNLPFLVLADSALTLPVSGGYRINAIIGFPMLRAIGSFTFGKGFFEPAPALTTGPRNLTAAGNDLFVSVKLGSFQVPLHLDTGAKNSELSARFAKRYPEALRNLVRSTERSAGAGGAVTQSVAQWTNVPISIADVSAVVPVLPIVIGEPEDVADETLGTLGWDVLQQFSAYTIDIGNMRFRPESDKS